MTPSSTTIQVVDNWVRAMKPVGAKTTKGFLDRHSSIMNNALRATVSGNRKRCVFVSQPVLA